MESILYWTISEHATLPGVKLLYYVPHKKTDFSFPSSYQLQRTSLLGMGQAIYFPSPG